MEKPKLEDIKFLGTMFGKDVWGNKEAEELINFLEKEVEGLRRQLDK